MTIRIPAFITLFFSSQVYASDMNLLATCGASKGYSYYVEGGLVDSNSAGFTDDGISTGSIQLLVGADGKTADIVQIDATDTRRSALEEGASTYPLINGSNISVIVLYQGVVENYTFRSQSNEVTWSKSSFGYSLDKHSLYRSSCVFE